jgi:alcohol dehydrogenase, propanol-preferring
MGSGDQFGVIFSKANAPLEYKKLPIPNIAPDEVLVNIKYTGVCHSDFHAWKGIFPSYNVDKGDWPIPTKDNLVGGHEGAGIVVATGNNVHDIQIGDHVCIKVLSSKFS